MKITRKNANDYLVIFIVCFVGLLFSLFLSRSATSTYHHELLSVFRDDFRAHLPKTDENLKQKWVNPGARMASRIFFEHRDELLDLADNLEPSKTAFDLWRINGSDTYNVLPYFYLSLMAGDLSSSYLIIKNGIVKSAYVYEDDWILALTATYWQGANEYLHELDFGRSALFNNLYLSASRIILGSRESGAIGFVERNRTLSHILQREIVSGRVKAMCNEPGVSLSFGRMLWGPWGSEIPEEVTTDLETRRKINYAFHCTGRSIERVPYGEIRLLKDDNPPYTACKYWPVECNYNRLLSLIFEGNIDEIHKEVFTFIKDCTYLSDDLMYWYISEMIYGENYYNQRFAIRIPIDVIDSVLSCSEKTNADFAARLWKLYESLPCGKIDWRHYSYHSTYTKDLIERCSVAKKAQ